MDGAKQGSARGESSQQAALSTAQVASTVAHPAKELGALLGPGPFALVCLFASPEADFETLTRDAQGCFHGAEIMACTTAGELGESGYETGQIVAIGFPKSHFSVSCYAIDGLDEIDEQAVIDSLIQRRLGLNRQAPDMRSEFAFLLVDGLSMREEQLTGVLASGLGPMPLFGGSAGDGTAFNTTWLSYNGKTRRNAALLAMVRSSCPVKVFSLDNLVPTDTRMVVTSADPDARIVHEINAEPAAAEYARLLGKDPNQLDPFFFATNPVVVRLGTTHHVRAIRHVSDNGDLVFFSAINEGMVLSIADRVDIADHLDRGLQTYFKDGAPELILGCDCLLRRIEASRFQKTREICETLQRHKVMGFSTYGEQVGSLHVNQTFTGVAIYPPDQEA